nr:replicase [White snakeroot virus A]
MESIQSILRFLRRDYRPAPGVYTRDECAAAYDPTWAVLICQQRMTDTKHAGLAAWYECAEEVNFAFNDGALVNSAQDAETCLMPQPDSVEMPSTTVEEAESGRDSPSPNEPCWDLAAEDLQRFERLKRLSTFLETVEDVEEKLAYGPHYPAGYEHNPCRTLVVYHPPGAFLPPPPTPPILLPWYPMVESKASSCANLCRGAWDAIRRMLRVKKTPVEWGSRAGATHTPSEVIPDVWPREVPGASMAYMNSATVAMELRKRFGVVKATPQNLMMGGRVAREILSEQCTAPREAVWYMGEEAVLKWLSPTVLDLVQRTKPQDFLLGAVETREGVETKTMPIILSPSMRIKKATRPRAVGRVSHFIDAVRPDCDYGVHNNSLNNLVRGVNERVFYTDNVGTTCTEPIKHAFDSIDVQDLKTFRVSPWTLDEVVESYTGRQQTRYAAARDSILERSLQKKDARVATFIKAEKVNFTAKPDPAPRVIQPRDPRFNVVFAKYIKPLEPMLYKALGRLYKHPCVAKGFNAVQTGEIIAKKWAMFNDPVCVGLDASRFDQHVSVDALKFTHSIYRKFVKNDEFNTLLQRMYTNYGLATAKDGIIRYKVRGERMSGDMDTALGNCVLMVLMTRHLCKSLNIPHELFDNGDDCIVIFNREHLQRFNDAVKPYFTTLGFKMKVEAPVYTLEKVEFCQTQPVYDGVKWRMVRGIPSIAKDLSTVLDWEQAMSWWHAIGCCGLAIAGGIPIYNSLYKWLKRIGNASNVAQHPLFRCGMVHMAQGLDCSRDAISPECRLSFAAAFGITPDMQIALEHVYDALGTPVVDNRDIQKSQQRRVFNHYFLPDNLSVCSMAQHDHNFSDISTLCDLIRC